jgi:2-amino-4-hydroxy-6-hydroxymethyldihydropteridine diphosphokinase
MSTALLSLGSNLGDREAHLRAAVKTLQASLVPAGAVDPDEKCPEDGRLTSADANEKRPDDGPSVTVSAVYRTPPWGDPDQPAYLNAAALVHVEKRTAEDWLAVAQALESAAGRVRDPARRFGPRTLDVDVIAVWDDDGTPVILDDLDLTVPHPRAHLRAFVLRPWLDVQPDAELPGHGRVDDLLRTAPVAADLPDVVREADLRLTKTA